ncbi:MAG: ABC transporter [Micromonosporaceae bacterium]
MNTLPNTRSVVAPTERETRNRLHRVEPVGPVRPNAGPAADTALGDAVVAAREAAALATFPLALPGALRARDWARALITELDDYVLPRLLRLDAPLLAVVGGSTGAGKSTLVNSLIRAPVSRAGVIRPTTRAPVLVAHPADATWFTAPELLPGLTRTPGLDDIEDVAVLRVVPAPGLVPGVALVDAPDIDSVVSANRRLAREVLAAGDLWLFVTTAARYADAVPWRVLREAQHRGTAVAVVLDRVEPAVADEIAAHLRGMLRERQLGDAPLFVVPEAELDPYGMLAEDQVAEIGRWIDSIARDRPRRAATARHGLLGTVSEVEHRLNRLATAADDQAAAAVALRAAVDEAYARALSTVEAGVGDGSVLRGLVYTRWREAVASGELTEQLRAAGRGSAADGLLQLIAAVAATLTSLITEAAIGAADHVRRRWRAETAGRLLLAAEPPASEPPTADLVNAWHAAHDTPLTTIAAVAPPRDDITADGPGPDLLRAIVDLNPEAADAARADLLGRARAELDHAAGVWHAVVEAAGIAADAGPRLRAAAARLATVRTALPNGATTREAA